MEVSPERLTRWRAACGFLATETPAEALVQTYGPPTSLQWYVARPEYQNYKNMPQDATSLVEWERLRKLLSVWPRRHQPPYSRDALDRLHEQTGIDYLVTQSTIPFAVRPVYRNSYYQVIRVTPDEP